jgi:hypothetical protein
VTDWFYFDHDLIKSIDFPEEQWLSVGRKLQDIFSDASRAGQTMSAWQAQILKIKERTSCLASTGEFVKNAEPLDEMIRDLMCLLTVIHRHAEALNEIARSIGSLSHEVHNAFREIVGNSVQASFDAGPHSEATDGKVKVRYLRRGDENHSRAQSFRRRLAEIESAVDEKHKMLRLLVSVQPVLARHLAMILRTAE